LKSLRGKGLERSPKVLSSIYAILRCFSNGSPTTQFLSSLGQYFL